MVGALACGFEAVIGMWRIYAAGALVAGAVAAVMWIRADAAADREKQLRSDAIERVVIDIREDQESDKEIDKKSVDDLRRELNRWLRR